MTILDEVMQREQGRWRGKRSGQPKRNLSAESKANSGDCGDRSWSEPVEFGGTAEVPPFPIHVFPKCLQPLVIEGARAFNCPPDFIAALMIGTASGAIGNARRIAITDTHSQPAIVFIGIVAPPGAAKSPAMRAAIRPLEEVQQGHQRDWQAKREVWEQADKDERGNGPSMTRVYASNTTTEALGGILQQNPRGILMGKNELASLVASFNQYKGGRGDDRQFYLDLWDGQTLIVDRKAENNARGGSPLFVSNPFCSIIGTLQPDVVSRLRGEPQRGVQPPNDGFIDRFLISYPADIPAVGEQWADIPREVIDKWQVVIEGLLNLEMMTEGTRTRPHYLRLNASGRKVWQRFTDQHAAQRNDESFPAHLQGPWAKLTGYCARLALIVHLLRWVTEETNNKEVDAESLNRAVALVDYFKGHTRKVCSEMDADPKARNAKKVLRWIRLWVRSNNSSSFTKRDAQQALKGSFSTIDDLEPVLLLIEKHGYIRMGVSVEKDGPGRKPSPIYEVHPSLLEIDPHNPQN